LNFVGFVWEIGKSILLAVSTIATILRSLPRYNESRALLLNFLGRNK